MADVLVLVESNTTGTGRLFVERARDLGLAPHMLCADALRYPYVGEMGIPAWRCDTSSSATVLEMCRQLAGTHELAGVTSSSELFIATSARAARALGRPGEDPDRLAAARSKSVQRHRFAAAGVDSPPFRDASTVDDAVRAARILGFPVVVKPICRSGSIGVRCCRTGTEVAAHARSLLDTKVDERGQRLPAHIIVESYLAGPEYSVELLDGAAQVVVAKHLDQSRGFLETGHDVPAGTDPGTTARLAASARAALAALGLGWGAAHVELRVVDGRAYVIEVNPRLAGGMIPQAILAATGQDLIAELVARASGRRLPPAPARTGFASIRFVVPAADGEVRGVPDVAAARALPGVVDAAVTAQIGQRVVRQGSFLDRLGYAIAVGETRTEAAVRAERAAEALAVTIG